MCALTQVTRLENHVPETPGTPSDAMPVRSRHLSSTSHQEKSQRRGGPASECCPRPTNLFSPREHRQDQTDQARIDFRIVYLSQGKMCGNLQGASKTDVYPLSKQAFREKSDLPHREASLTQEPCQLRKKNA